MKKIIIGGGVIATLLYAINNSSNDSKLKAEILASSKSDGDTKFYVEQFFPKATHEEIVYVHKVVVKNIKADVDQYMKQQIWDKYLKFQLVGLGNPMVIMLVAKLLPYLLLAGGGTYLMNKLANAKDGRWEIKNYDKQYFVDDRGRRYNAIDLARKFNIAVQGIGTDEGALIANLAPKVRGNVWSKVIYAYKKMYGETLERAIEGDMSSWYREQFYAIKDNQSQDNLYPNETQFEFNIGVTVNTKGTGTSYKYIEKINGRWKTKYSRYWGFGNLGKITDRKRFRKSSGKFDNYYATEDYPTLYIIGSALKRVY